jgi:hypothetical protein
VGARIVLSALSDEGTSELQVFSAARHLIGLTHNRLRSARPTNRIADCHHYPFSVPVPTGLRVVSVSVAGRKAVVFLTLALSRSAVRTGERRLTGSANLHPRFKSGRRLQTN